MVLLGGKLWCVGASGLGVAIALATGAFDPGRGSVSPPGLKTAGPKGYWDLTLAEGVSALRA